jgi:putative redox protein
LRCTVRTERGFLVPVDEPVASGGTDAGPQPTDLFLASVASCFTLAVIYSARKRRINLEDVIVEVTGTYDGPRFAAIEMDVRLVGVPEEKHADLIAAAEQVCYVTRTLRDAPSISIKAHD